LNLLISLISYHKSILVVLSGACFIVGTAFLVKSIRWQSEDTADLINNKSAKKEVRKMDSPGHTEIKNLKIGIVLNAVGYALLIFRSIIST
jgi:hypothetical protein